MQAELMKKPMTIEDIARLTAIEAPKKRVLIKSRVIKGDVY
ncbi:MAG: hypothetical protein ACJ75F_05295 [Flavisolibacter sp.]|jgi:hypothetical protein